MRTTAMNTQTPRPTWDRGPARATPRYSRRCRVPYVARGLPASPRPVRALCAATTGLGVMPAYEGADEASALRRLSATPKNSELPWEFNIHIQYSALAVAV
jgi:hypothetical protein